MNELFGFAVSCRYAIDKMREAGMNDAIIATVIMEVRSQALSEEFWRLQELQRLNPPKHDSWTALYHTLKEDLPA